MEGFAGTRDQRYPHILTGADRVMPSGVFKITDIPEDKVEIVVADYQMENPVNIERIAQPNGMWTVIATFPDEGAMEKRFES